MPSQQDGLSTVPKWTPLPQKRREHAYHYPLQVEHTRTRREGHQQRRHTDPPEKATQEPRSLGRSPPELEITCGSSGRPNQDVRWLPLANHHEKGSGPWNPEPPNQNHDYPCHDVGLRNPMDRLQAHSGPNSTVIQLVGRNHHRPTPMDP